MGTARIIATTAVLLHMATVCAQTPYPELTIQDVSWMEGTHHYAVTNSILSPATPERPTEVGASADVEFVSATEVRLLPGFHAGAFNSQGQFHARIDLGLGQPADLVIISPAPDGSSPYGSIEDNVVHVHKWEKVEVGLRLPQEYQEAIDRFFEHYYPYNYPPHLPGNPNTNVAEPGNVDPLHDLNPYADDSLQVVMKLTKPDGSKTYKWGFFMQENDWENSDPEAKLVLDPNDPLNPYNIHFRFAPDSEGPWSFTISVKAPFTMRSDGSPILDVFYDGYTLYCVPPKADNKGYLSINPNNHRNLRFDTDEPFIGLGTNFAGPPEGPPGSVIGVIRYAYLDTLLQAFSALSSVGGNYARIFMGRGMFATEWHNLGVYDRYITSECFSPPQVGNCQTQSWAFDRLMDHARANGIYLQVCVDPYPPIIAYENQSWHSQAYYKHFLHPNRDQSSGRFNMKNFFYSYEGNANPDDPQSVKLHDEGVFYYWKRKYKYIMSRWGYSVNIAALEPFNELDQMLTYYEMDLRFSQGIEDQYYSTCPPNRRLWPRDETLKPVIKSWITDLAEYVRGSTTEEDLVDSPLGESKKLFLLSYAGNHPDDIAHYLPSTSSAVDLFDVHMGLEPKLQEPDPLLNDLYKVDERIFQGYSNAQALWRNFPTVNAPLSERRPFNHGEFNHYTKFIVPNPINPSGTALWSNDVEKIFHNYDVSFHNELWSSVFSGKFAAGTSWHWPRVFWWRGALPLPPPDPLNQMQLTPFTNALPGSNNLDIGLGIPIAIPNRRIHHHFQPLADLLNRPSVQELGIFSNSFTPSVFFDDDDSDGINPMEAYYLRSDQSTAIGWVHNRNASVAKSFYVRSGPLEHNFLGCTAPASSSITLSGLFSSHPHYVTWFPTRNGATDLPPDTEFPYVLMSTSSGDLTIDLSGYFNGIADNYLDTLHSDYAFVITPGPFVKSLAPDAVETEPNSGWDFSLYPNPTRDLLTLSFADDTIKDVALLDVSGRIVVRHQNIVALMLQIPTGPLAKGAYWVRVTSGDNMKVKKMIIH